MAGRRLPVKRSSVPSALASLNSRVSQRLADLLATDPEFRDSALEMGVIDQRWLEAPGERPLSHVPPVEVVRRFLERAVERKPSALARLGLSAVQVLADDAGRAKGTEAPSVITVVFTDLEGFTGFTAEHGDDAALDLLAAHHRVVGPIVRRWDGRIVKRLGDGLMLAFAEPGYAVRAAVELVDVPPAPLRLRAGVHTGKAVSTEDDLVGHAVNIAARVTDLAKGGQVLVSGEVIDAVGDIPGVRLSKPQRKRGVPDPIVVHRATADDHQGG